MSPLFFHSISEYTGNSHEVTAFLENGLYTVNTICHDTGTTHTRFFEDLRSFVLWHYANQNCAILDDTYAFEREVKVLYEQPTDKEIKEALSKTREKGIFRSTKWDILRVSNDTILWTV